MSNLLDLILFGIFVAAVIAVRLARTERARRYAVNALFLYVLAVHAVLAAARRDAWPFATHGVFLEKADEQRPLSNVRFVGVDNSGREHPLDPDSWSPISVRTLEVWWLVDFPRLSPHEQKSVMAFLLEKAQAARVARPSVLRLLAAPPWYSTEPAEAASTLPYAGFRAYLVTRIPAQKLATRAESSRLLAQFP